MSDFSVLSSDFGEGICRIARERLRQIKVEGYAVAEDYKYLGRELARAATCYVSFASASVARREEIRAETALGIHPAGWPWELQYWKPGPDNTATSRLRELEKAGALIAAQIDVLMAETDVETKDS